jgi:hypothetical protein
VGDDFGVGLGDETVTAPDEIGLEGEVVFNDAVVDDDEGAGAVAVGVRILFCRPAMGGPAGVADAEAALDGAGGDDGLKVAQLAGGAAQLQAARAAGNGDAGRVVAAVFEAAQAFNDDWDGVVWADVPDDSTHGMSLDGWARICSVRRMGLLGEVSGMGGWAWGGARG